ncbi:MAG: hypothetical protein JO267_13470 [Alphaproteobacteria bacterium]|nr:hypothetical protein [Alphaproteobacteria bacterium]MBV9863144.1 hypothetical protein [Alphaproteobacteria bacterium]
MNAGVAPIEATTADFPEPLPLLPHERREAERVIAYWDRKAAQLGEVPTVASLDLAAIHTLTWSHRFVIAVDPVVENSALLMYGINFARLLDLPQKTAPHIPMMRQLPKRFSQVFARGCGDAHAQNAPIRLEGEVDRDDGRRELYRAAFIPVGVKPNSLTHLALGAFNSCVN